MTEKEIKLALPLSDAVNLVIVMETALWYSKESIANIKSVIDEIDKLMTINVHSNDIETQKKADDFQRRLEILESVHSSKEIFVESIKEKISENGVDVEKEISDYLKYNPSPWRV